VDDNQLNLTESNFSFVKAQDLWFTIFEPTPSKKSKVFNLLPLLITYCSLLFFAEGVGLEPTRPQRATGFQDRPISQFSHPSKNRNGWWEVRDEIIFILYHSTINFSLPCLSFIFRSKGLVNLSPSLKIFPTSIVFKVFEIFPLH
jgi:hypothetical protein